MGLPSLEAERIVHKEVLFDTPTTGDCTIYTGWADQGKADSDKAWRIRKTIWIDATGDLTKLYASGELKFNKVFDDRASYVYS